MPPAQSSDEIQRSLPPFISVKLVQQVAYISSSQLVFPQTRERRELVYCRSEKRVIVRPPDPLPGEIGSDYELLPAELASRVSLSTVKGIELIRSRLRVDSSPRFLESFVLSESSLQLLSPTNALSLTLTNRSRVVMDHAAVSLAAVILDSSISLDAKYTNSISISGPGTQACPAIVTHKVASPPSVTGHPDEALESAFASLYAPHEQRDNQCMCTICLEEIATVGLNGCGHLVICGHCLPRAVQSGLVDQARCPVCRSTDPPRTNTLHIRQQSRQWSPQSGTTVTTPASHAGFAHRFG